MSKNKTKKNSTKQKLLHAAMVAIMLVPLLVTGVQNVGMKTIHAVPRETVNLVVTKFVYGDIPSSSINNGGHELENTPEGAQAQEDVPFILFQARNSMSAPLWSAINKYIQNYQPGGFVDISKDVEGTPEKEAAAKNEITDTEWHTTVGNTTFAVALQAAYLTAANNLGVNFPNTNTPKNMVKYPVETWEHSAIVLALLQNIATFGDNNNRLISNVTTAHATGEKGNKTDSDGRVTFTDIDNIDQAPMRSRYILLEDPTSASTGMLIKSERPMVIDLPYADVPEDEENIYVYPKNVSPRKDAEFRKVNMSKNGGASEGGTDPVSGATLDPGEIMPLSGAKFALFQYDGEASRWGELKRTKLTAYQDGNDWKITESPNSIYLPQKNTAGNVIGEGLYTSDNEGIVKSPELPLGKYYFVEVATPSDTDTTFNRNRYPVTFEVSPAEIAKAGIRPIHAVSYASELDKIVIGEDPVNNPGTWQFPNYDMPELTKTLDISGIGNENDNDVQDNSKFTYHLKADLSSADAFLDRYIAFYDMFTKTSQTVGDDGYFSYPTYPQSTEEDAKFPARGDFDDDDAYNAAVDSYLAALDDGDYFDSLIDISKIFDIKTGTEQNANHFWDNDNENVTKNEDIATTPITGGVDSNLTLYTNTDGTNDKKKPLVYFGESHGANSPENIAKYGVYIGGFDAKSEGNQLGQLGWYDVKKGSSNTWVETGTKTGTQMYWSINTVVMFNLIKANEKIQELYPDIDEETSDSEESGTSAMTAFMDSIVSIGLDFTLTPKLADGENALSLAAVQALHNIGQFEWNDETYTEGDVPPYVEDKFDAYVGGQVFTKLSDEGVPLFTDQDSTEHDGHFVISRVNRAGVREYLKYNKEENIVEKWVPATDGWEAEATWFDTSEATNGKFKVYGLTPNADYSNGAKSGSLTMRENPIYRYYVDEPEALELNNQTYETMPRQEFLVAPVTTTSVTPEDAELGSTSLGETTMTNFKERRFPITGGLGIVTFVLLGLALTLIGAKYFKRRKLQENE